MEIILHALQGVTTVLIMIGIGFELARRGWFSEESTRLVSKLVTNVSLPCFMLASIPSQFDRAHFLGFLHGLVIPFCSMLLCYAVGRVIARAIGVHPGRRGIYTTCVSMSNTIFIGLPLVLALFGNEAIPFIMMYYMANTTLFWTISAHDIAMDGTAGAKSPLFSMSTLKSIMSPPLLGFIGGVVLVLFDTQLPAPVQRAFTYMGATTTPLAMIFIGIAMSRTKWQEIHIDREVLTAVVGRFVLCPVCVMIMLPFFDIPPLMAQTFIMMAAMPAMTNTSIVAEYYGADYKYAAMLTVITTCMAVFTTPFYMWILKG